MSTGKKPRRGSRAGVRALPWVQYSDEQLLDLRFRDLSLKVEGTVLEQRVERLYGELDRRGLRFRPHVWLSSEWFSPDGVPGIAIPFYLAHPRLMRLEGRQMLEVEGGSERSCMRVLRHEAGHAIDTAYRLHFKKSWRRMFGPYSKPYPQFYRPRPASRRFVLHLDDWYAQAHPAEDFAETFAVWLAPRSSWRRRYGDWPVALRKLEYVDELMQAIAGQRPRVASRVRVESLRQLSETLRQHYRKKRKRYRYGGEWSQHYDGHLLHLFSRGPGSEGRPTAASFLRGSRAELRGTVAEWTGAHPYTIDQVLQDMIDRCRELKLRLSLPPATARQQAVILLTVHTMNCLHAGRQWIPV